jgi:hypothetical protein
MMDSASIIVPHWPAPARVRAACTTRIGGVSRGPYAGLNLGLGSGDDAADVAENRRRLAAMLELPSEPCWLRQIHGTRVARLPDEAPLPEADAGVTTERGVVCAVQAADCLPVLFCDEAATAVAAAHAGWRGLAAGVLEATVAAMSVTPQRLMAWLGPAIGPGAFEVGAEVRAAFVERDTQAATAFTPAPEAGKYFADLFLLARQRLVGAGIVRIYGGGLCTHTDARRFFSHRRDRVTGRQAALIWLQGME